MKSWFAVRSCDKVAMGEKESIASYWVWEKDARGEKVRVISSLDWKKYVVRCWGLVYTSWVWEKY